MLGMFCSRRCFWGLFGVKGIMNCNLFLLSLFAAFHATAAKVVLMGSDVTLSFDDIEANFAPSIKGSGECGILYLAEPLDACAPLTNKAEQHPNVSSSFVLIIRGGCNFGDKVRSAQKAGFKAAIIYDNEDDGTLVSMAGDPNGIRINAVFISEASGEMLKKYAGLNNLKIWLIPSFGNTAWSIVEISFISLLAMLAVLATCFFIRRHGIRRERSQASLVREFHGMSKQLVKAMPSLIFSSVLEDNCTSTTCTICLEDYNVGEKLRILPCRHKFHAFCVDSWLTSWRAFCPVCKRDARTGTCEPPASESTPLLASGAGSFSSSILSSRSSSVASPAIHILPASLLSVSRPHSLASTHYASQSLASYHQSPPLSINQSSVDQRNASETSETSNLVSSYPSASPLNTRYISVNVRSSSNTSVSIMGSSSLCQHRLHSSESATSFSPFASAHSLPEC